MALKFVTDGAWGTGQGSPLTPAEVDGNFHEVDQRLDAVETNPAEPVEIASVSAVGTQMTIHMDDGSTRGPITLPTAVIRYRGDWAPATSYLELDLVHVADDGLYLVLEDHTSDATFDPAADDGEGNLLYKFLLPATTAGGGAGTAPTRTVVDLTGVDGSSEVEIPDGCTWFRAHASSVTMGNASVSPSLLLLESSGGSAQLFSGREVQNGDAYLSQDLTSQSALASGGGEGTTAKFLMMTVWAPLDATKKTLLESHGGNSVRDRRRHLVQDAAAASTHLSVSSGAGVISSGTLEIEWFYS